MTPGRNYASLSFKVLPAPTPTSLTPLAPHATLNYPHQQPFPYFHSIYIALLRKVEITDTYYTANGANKVMDSTVTSY